MGKIKSSKKMKITSIFKATQQHVHPWHWPSCIQQPKTLSFRAGYGGDIFKTVNSVFLEGDGGFESLASCFTNTSASASFSTESEDACRPVEALVREMVWSKECRLFFEPGENKTSSILHHKARRAPENGDGKGVLLFKGRAVALALESEDPYHDFRRSMEEMVESHGLEDWDCLEELLSWYLRVNGDANHGLIIDAFTDLLLSISPNCVVPHENATTNTTSYSSAASSFSNCEIKEKVRLSLS